MDKQELIDKLNQEMARHDWYYNMSDDHRYWVAGTAHWKLIEDWKKELNDDDIFNQIYEKYSPWAKEKNED